MCVIPSSAFQGIIRGIKTLKLVGQDQKLDNEVMSPLVISTRFEKTFFFVFFNEINAFAEKMAFSMFFCAACKECSPRNLF